MLKEGSDPPRGMAALLMHQALVMDVEAGVPPMMAIQSATLNVAKSLQTDKDYGSVEVGKVADLSIIEGDPLQDIWMTQNVKMVVMDGKVIDIAFQKYKNPIPSFYSYQTLPLEIDISPLLVTAGTGPTVLKVRGKGMWPFHRVWLNGQELPTRYVGNDELEATHFTRGDLPTGDLRRHGRARRRTAAAIAPRPSRRRLQGKGRGDVMNEASQGLFARRGAPPDEAVQTARKKVGPLRIGAFKTDALHRFAVERVQLWTRSRFDLLENAPVLVSELECKRLGCPPLETVVAFWTDDESRYHFKMFKPIVDVRFEDLPPAWLRKALFGTDDDGMGCC